MKVKPKNRAAMRLRKRLRKLEARKPPGARLSRLLTESFVIRESRKISRRWDLDLILSQGGGK